MNKMQTLDDVFKYFENELKKHPIDIQTFRDWQSSPVTQRMYLELTNGVMESMYDNDFSFKSVEEVALRQSYARGIQDGLKMMIDWEPEGTL